MQVARSRTRGDSVQTMLPDGMDQTGRLSEPARNISCMALWSAEVPCTREDWLVPTVGMGLPSMLRRPEQPLARWRLGQTPLTPLLSRIPACPRSRLRGRSQPTPNFPCLRQLPRFRSSEVGNFLSH